MSESIPSARDVLDIFAGYSDSGERAPGSYDRPVKLATVDPAYTGTGNPRVTFDGESALTTRGYVWASPEPPGAGKRVVMLPVGQSFVILGVIGQVQGVIRIDAAGDCSLTSTDHALQIGLTSGVNLIIDNNEIQGRNGGVNPVVASALYINTSGGAVTLGTAADTVSLPGRVNTPHLPWAVAAGKATQAPGVGGSSAPIFWTDLLAVTFPLNRFAVGVVPIVTAVAADNNGAASVMIGVAIGTVSATGFNYRLLRVGAVPTSAHSILWTATQMTATVAAG